MLTKLKENEVFAYLRKYKVRYILSISPENRTRLNLPGNGKEF